MSSLDYGDFIYMHALTSTLEPLDAVYHSSYYTRHFTV